MILIDQPVVADVQRGESADVSRPGQGGETVRTKTDAIESQLRHPGQTPPLGEQPHSRIAEQIATEIQGLGVPVRKTAEQFSQAGLAQEHSPQRQVSKPGH